MTGRPIILVVDDEPRSLQTLRRVPGDTFEMITVGSAEHLNAVFDPFFTTKPVGQGTGLGLWISDGLVRDHGGTLRVANRFPKGAVFTVDLPVA